ncbi:hypothetical protein PS862_02096 [Pseudomonas fluorescens]|uniref:Uncharacterized protein n=1 Tax=Pseudomonas fluorescens TaxID=294 RepID=A0A5E7JFV4_PSEFL|nr:hypothetical protein [Pseudomonas fluorescens]VVO86147.1 hypothetical protein PS862_02096 [Pseudomonas fluorescens]
MSVMKRVGWRRGILALAGVTLLSVAAIQALSGEPEIALVIGEPYEAMRQRSSAPIGPAIPGHSWFSIPKSDARLRFVDTQFGFVTPLARYFTVMFDDELINGVRMSPQIEPLLLDDTLKVVLDLQAQWRKGGWKPIWVTDFPSFADTSQWRAQLQDGHRISKAYWQADNQYQVMLAIRRFKDDKRPTDERYLITLALASPWGEF